MVHIAIAVSSGALDSLDPFFNDLFTAFGGNDRYCALNVGSGFELNRLHRVLSDTLTSVIESA